MKKINSLNLEELNVKSFKNIIIYNSLVDYEDENGYYSYPYYVEYDFEKGVLEDIYLDNIDEDDYCDDFEEAKILIIEKIEEIFYKYFIPKLTKAHNFYKNIKDVNLDEFRILREPMDDEINLIKENENGEKFIITFEKYSEELGGEFDLKELYFEENFYIEKEDINLVIFMKADKFSLMNKIKESKHKLFFLTRT